MDYKVKLMKCQNEYHHGDVFDMWTKWAKPQAKCAQRSAGWPNTLVGWLGLESSREKTSLTHLYVGSQGRIRGLKVVELERSGWPAGHVDGWPAVHLLQTDIAKLVETYLYPYIRPPMAKDSTSHSTCSSPLVKVWFSSSSAGEAPSGVESRVEFSL
jgi:hypothetical protein